MALSGQTRDAQAELRSATSPDADVDPWAEGDRRLLGRLRQRNFAGPLYEAFEVELAAYALPVMLRLMRTGEIFKRCQRLGLPVDDGQLAWGRWVHRDHVELAKRTIAHGLQRLREDILRPASPTIAAATISSLFLTVCLRQFPEHLQALVDDRLGGRARVTEQQAEDSETGEPRSHYRWPADRGRPHRENAAGLESIADEELRNVARLIDAGKSTYAEAAAEMGISPAVLSERLRSREIREIRVLRTVPGRPA